MKKHFFFDMDGTLTPSRQEASEQMRRDLASMLKAGLHVVVVSGAEHSQIAKQLPGLLGGDYGMYVLAQNGNDAYGSTHGYRFSGESHPDRKWRNELTWVQKRMVLNLIERIIKGSGEELEADMVEDRGCQISYSAVGHHAPIEKKKAYDPRGEIRKSVMEDVYLPWFNELRDSAGVKAAIGGTTCIDFYRKTKGENIAELVELEGWKREECLYVGDQLYRGGNDATVVGVIPTLEVGSPDETMDVIRGVLKRP